MLQLKEPEEYDEKYSKWKIEDLPICPERLQFIPKNSGKQCLAKIKYCFTKYDSSEFILATDAEREGEVIGAEILNHLAYTNPNSKRFWVSEALTKDVVLKGLQNAQPLENYKKYKDEGFARMQADWLVGMNISRLLTVSTQTLITFGRVQTVILGAIYLREKAIEEFQSVNYNQLEITAGTNSKSFKLNLFANNTDRFMEADSFFEQAVNKIIIGDKLIIKSIESETKTEYPPALFNITGLQKHCSNKYKITPVKTLEIAQKLYEEYKCLSYPRTPSTVLGDENVDLYKSKYELLSKKYPELSQSCVVEKINIDNKRLFNSSKLQDHHGLIPLDVISDKATEQEKNVYMAVLQRFFNVIKEPFVYNQIKIYGTAKEYGFYGTGRQLIQYGYKADLEEDEEIQIFPKLNEEEVYPILNCQILTKQTQPKKHYTQATLLALMENPKGEDENYAKLVGIGTPATRADRIDVLIKRSYIEQKGQNLLITDKGKFIIESILKIPELKDFISIAKTTEWEMQLSNNPEDFLNAIKDFIKNKITNITITDKWERSNFGNCPSCNSGKIYESEKSYYCSRYKEGCHFTVWKNICGTTVNRADIKALILGEKTKKKKMKSKAGKEFIASLQIVNGKTELVFDK